MASRWFGSYKLSEQCLQIRQEQFDMVRKREGEEGRGRGGRGREREGGRDG